MPGGHGGDGSVTPGMHGNATLPEQVVNSALNYQIAKPVIDAIMQDAGLGSGSLTSISQAMASLAVPGATDKPAQVAQSAVPSFLEAPAID